MIVGKRVLAFGFDLGLCVFLGMFLLGGLFTALEIAGRLFHNLGMGSISIETHVVDPLMKGQMFPLLILSLCMVGCPSLFLGICSHFFGKSLGKWILGIKVVNQMGGNPSFSVAVCRELMKYFLLFIPFMWIFLLFQVLLQDNTIYDQLLGTSVVGKPKLTAIQKKFMKYYGTR